MIIPIDLPRLNSAIPSTTTLKIPQARNLPHPNITTHKLSGCNSPLEGCPQGGVVSSSARRTGWYFLSPKSGLVFRLPIMRAAISSA